MSPSRTGAAVARCVVAPVIAALPGQVLAQPGDVLRLPLEAAGGLADHRRPRRRDPNQRLPAVKPGLTFHGLRHSHKTWMIADNVPEIAQARRLGHILDDKIRQTYSHVAAEVEHRLLDALTDRWDKAVADSPHQSAWREP